MFKLKRTYIKVAKVARPGVAPHIVVFHEGKWTCSFCSVVFRKRNKDGCALGGTRDKACPGRCRIREGMHSSHEGHTARTPMGTRITFCSACGAYGAAKAVLLKGRCEPDTRHKSMTQWSAINDPARASHCLQGREPIIAGAGLHSVWPLQQRQACWPHEVLYTGANQQVFNLYQKKGPSG